MANEVILGDVADSDILPDPSGEMYEFYEGLDTNLFSESTGINHNAATKWLKTVSLKNLEYLSYLLSVKNGQTIMSDDLVHTEAIQDDAVDWDKLSAEIRTLLQSISLINVVERNSVQTLNCISVSGGKIKTLAGTIISQANGFNANGQDDLNEVLTEVDLVSTIGNGVTGYLYKAVGGAYTQSLSKASILTLGTMVGTKVFLGTFTVDSFGVITEVNAAVPAFKARTIEEPIFTGGFIALPDGDDSTRPASPKAGYIRYNSQLPGYEGYSNGNWSSLGGGQMLGQALVKAVSYNSQVIEEDLIIPTGLNAYSVGDITIADGVTVTIEDGSIYKIL